MLLITHLRRFSTTLLFLTMVLIPFTSHAEKSTSEPTEVKLVRDLISAYERLDWDAVADMFAEDGTLHSVMRSPFSGREVLRERLVQFHEGVTSMQLDVLHIVKVGDVVIVERMDHFVMAGVKRRIPAVGVLTIEDNKVKLWKEYYDLASLKARMSPDFPGDE